MEKVIKLIMNADKSIKILVNDEEKHIIDAQNRSISADKIYEIIGFAVGDQYSVVSENVLGVDKQVLEFFVELLTDVSKKVNAIIVPSNSSPTV
ncbi:hypothetical protein [Anaeropeptidivorans aminofermentans]|uniref:hypothetical protein n=1 Tax=Anaeropeptidivorans aminofermentans TaxID=2934315 RepID=UPI002025A855|nr:hypothetical protein [Anaeropeptidivorans aminofermentans]